jgi:hypothetical protein
LRQRDHEFKASLSYIVRYVPPFKKGRKEGKWGKGGEREKKRNPCIITIILPFSSKISIRKELL